MPLKSGPVSRVYLSRPRLESAKIHYDIVRLIVRRDAKAKGAVE